MTSINGSFSWWKKSLSDLTSEDWKEAVLQLASHYEEKNGRPATHINVHEDHGELVASLFPDMKVVTGMRLINEIVVGERTDSSPIGEKVSADSEPPQVAQQQAKKKASKLQSIKAQQLAKKKHPSPPPPPQQVSAKTIVESPVYDKSSATVTYDGLEFYEVVGEDAVAFIADPEGELEYMKDSYEFNELGQVSA